MRWGTSGCLLLYAESKVASRNRFRQGTNLSPQHTDCSALRLVNYSGEVSEAFCPVQWTGIRLCRTTCLRLLSQTIDHIAGLLSSAATVDGAVLPGAESGEGWLRGWGHGAHREKRWIENPFTALTPAKDYQRWRRTMWREPWTIRIPVAAVRLCNSASCLRSYWNGFWLTWTL